MTTQNLTASLEPNDIPCKGPRFTRHAHYQGREELYGLPLEVDFVAASEAEMVLENQNAEKLWPLKVEHG